MYRTQIWLVAGDSTKLLWLELFAHVYRNKTGWADTCLDICAIFYVTMHRLRAMHITFVVAFAFLCVRLNLSSSFLFPSIFHMSLPVSPIFVRHVFLNSGRDIPMMLVVFRVFSYEWMKHLKSNATCLCTISLIQINPSICTTQLTHFRRQTLILNNVLYIYVYICAKKLEWLWNFICLWLVGLN